MAPHSPNGPPVGKSENNKYKSARPARIRRLNSRLDGFQIEKSKAVLPSKRPELQVKIASEPSTLTAGAIQPEVVEIPSTSRSQSLPEVSTPAILYNLRSRTSRESTTQPRPLNKPPEVSKGPESGLDNFECQFQDHDQDSNANGPKTQTENPVTTNSQAILGTESSSRSKWPSRIPNRRLQSGVKHIIWPPHILELETDMGNRNQLEKNKLRPRSRLNEPSKRSNSELEVSTEHPSDEEIRDAEIARLKLILEDRQRVEKGLKERLAKIQSKLPPEIQREVFGEEGI